MLDIFKVLSMSENVFKLLAKEDWLNCRLVCQTWKSILDEPCFWLEKLKSIGHPQEIHDQWLDLIQKSIIQDGKHKQILALCLMIKFYYISGLENTVLLVWRKQCLNFPPILHSPAQISAQIGHDLRRFSKRRFLFEEKATFTMLSVSKEVKG